MKTTFLIVGMALGSISTFAQGTPTYTYKPAQQGTYNPATLLQKYGGTVPPTTYPAPTYMPPPVVQNTVTVNNKSYDAKEVEIYVQNMTTFKWEYVNTVRIPGGGTFSHTIGQYEKVYTYGYFVVGGLLSSVTSFTSYPVTLY